MVYLSGHLFDAFAAAIHSIRLVPTVIKMDALNKDLYDKFRQEYCLRICYIINKESKIIDKFQVIEWEKN